MAIFRVGNFGDLDLFTAERDRTGVKYLAAAGGIEGSAVENDCRTRCLVDFADFGVEVVQERVVVVEAVRHGRRIYLTTEGACTAQSDPSISMPHSQCSRIGSTQDDNSKRRLSTGR